MNLELTKEQAQVLVNILDVATKAGGLQVAESCLFFVKKLQEAEKALTTQQAPQAVEPVAGVVA